MIFSLWNQGPCEDTTISRDYTKKENLLINESSFFLFLVGKRAANIFEGFCDLVQDQEELRQQGPEQGHTIP